MILCYCKKIDINYTSPSWERITEIGFVSWNRANIILRLAMSGTAKNAPAIHQILDQNISEIRIIKPLKLSLFHISFGSIIFQVINCGIKRQARKAKDNHTVSNSTKLYRNGRDNAIIPQIAGIKSSKNTKSANKSAYSIPKANITIKLTKPLIDATKNLERINTLRSS